MHPFLSVTAEADPKDYPELVDVLRNHREKIVSQIASLQQIVDFIDTKLEDGKDHRNCSDEKQNSLSVKKVVKPKSTSPAEISYFSISAKAAKNQLR